MRPDPARGVFDTLLAGGGRAHELHEHLARLAASVRELYGESLPAHLDDRLHSVASTIVEPHRIRLDYVPGQPLAIAVEPANGTPETVYELRPREIPGGLGPHKWRDRRPLSSDGTYVPLIIDGDDVLEAARANVWIVEGGRAITPPVDGRILPGVTRALLLERDRTAREERISLARAERSEAIFLSSSIRRVAGATLGPELTDSQRAMIARWASLASP